MLWLAWKLGVTPTLILRFSLNVDILKWFDLHNLLDWDNGWFEMFLKTMFNHKSITSDLLVWINQTKKWITSVEHQYSLFKNKDWPGIKFLLTKGWVNKDIIKEAQEKRDLSTLQLIKTLIN